MTSTTASVVSAGYMPLDIVRTPTGTIARSAGGTAANVAAIMAFLGWTSVLAGQTGDDDAGDELVRDLRTAGVDTRQVHRAPSALTPRLVHHVRPEGHSFGYRCPDCGSAFPRSRPLTLEQARLCIDAHPRPTVYFFDRANAGTIRLAEHYAEQGTVVTFEPSVPANADLLARAVRAADIIKHSDDRSVGGLADLGVATGPGQVCVITHGADGLELRVGRGRSRRLRALATLAVDTGGAGDWTTAGLLAKALQGGQFDHDRIEDALHFGQALASIACATVGARAPMRLTRGSVLRRARAVLREGGLTSPLRLPTPEPPNRRAGACTSCLMPVADQLALPTGVSV
jgi:sugar/nucleoside kinase (ribokinase family)